MTYVIGYNNREGVKKMSTPKVRILADVTPEVKEKLKEVCATLNTTQVELFTNYIEELHKKHVRKES